jgi:hypothetical protein
MTNKTKNYILVAFVLGFFLLLITTNKYESKKNEAVVKYTKMQSLFSNIKQNQDKFTYAKTQAILNSSTFKQYIQVQEKDKLTTIVFNAPLKVANAFIRKLANSDALLGEIEIQQINKRVKIIIKIKNG